MKSHPLSFGPRVATGQIDGVSGDRSFACFGNLMLALAVVGYPLSAAVSQLTEADSNAINLAFRITILVLSLLLGIWTIARGQYQVDALILVFLMIYTIRMVSDLTYSGLPDIKENFQFYMAITLIPTLSLGGGLAWYNEKTFAWWITLIGGLAGLLIAYTLLFRPDEMLLEALDQRASFKFLNPISIGYHGLYIAAAALILIAILGKRRWILLLGAVTVLGGYLLLVSGSRGPIVALVLGVGLTGFANTRTAGAYAIIGLGVAALLMVVGAPELIIQRFFSIGADASSLERFYATQLSLQAAIDHPLFGFAYIEPVTGLYPHNLLVEAAMALGMAGAALMLWMQIRLIVAAWWLAQRGDRLLPFIAASVFANSWISGSIWGAGLFFAVLWTARGRVRFLSSQPQHNRHMLRSAQGSQPLRQLMRGG